MLVKGFQGVRDIYFLLLKVIYTFSSLAVQAQVLDVVSYHQRERAAITARGVGGLIKINGFSN